jgi:hypothetical protein
VPDDNCAREYSSGAQRSESKPPYWQIPYAPIALLAERFGLGASKYSANNWKKGIGDDAYLRQMYNHLFEHILKLPQGGDDEDDTRATIGAILWNAVALAYYYDEDPAAFERAFPHIDKGDL